MAISNSTQPLSLPAHNVSSMAGVATIQHEKKSCSFSSLPVDQLLHLIDKRIKVAYPFLDAKQTSSGFVQVPSTGFMVGVVIAVIVPSANHLEERGVLFLEEGYKNPDYLDLDWHIVDIF